jgi:hypothetical protein
MDFVLVYFKGMAKNIVEIDESFKCNLHHGGGGSTKAKKCPCCEKLWGSKIKFN